MFISLFFPKFLGLLRHWQEMLHLIVKRLQLSDTLSKLILDIQTLESNLSDVAKSHNQQQQQQQHQPQHQQQQQQLHPTSTAQKVIHNKNDLERDIQELKVIQSFKQLFGFSGLFIFHLAF